MIEGLGCTEAALGCPIRSTMETVELPSGGLPTRVLHDKAALGLGRAVALCYRSSTSYQIH